MNMKYNLNDVPSDLRNRMSELVDRLDTGERRTRRHYLNIAASLLVLLSIGSSVMIVSEPEKQSTELTPEQAAKETERALKIFAKAIKQGQEGAVKAEKAGQDATRKAFKTINNYSK